ncbi:MAG: adenylate/guanylate cyclase domain-containing protein [Sulfuritalea sp.]|nr:adenylate/guanylate cyclase domain-containing protein [Sulfuritalea sp.]
MTLKDDLTLKVWEFTVTRWSDIPTGYVVPTPENLTQGNTGKRINATVLYADISGSTDMVDALPDTRAAEYYKAFLHCAAKIIKGNGGDITAYDGDRVMGIYIGNEQAGKAVTAALNLSWAVANIINPTFADFYGTDHRPLHHTVGIDCGKLLAAKAGVRDDNDLVWVGPAANYAAKLNSFDGLDPDYPIRITEDVRTQLTPFLLTTNTGAPVWDGPYHNLDRGPHYRTRCNIALT